MAWTYLTTIAFVLLLIGIALLIAGIILFEMAVSKGQNQKTYTWILMIGGGILAVIAAIWMVFTLRPKAKVEIIGKGTPVTVAPVY